MGKDNATHICDTCRWKGSKRCDICSHRYQDRYEPTPPPKPIKKGDAMLMLCALTLLNGEFGTKGLKGERFHGKL